MAVFQYTVRDQTGNVRTGTSEAENPEVLKRRLQEQGFTVSDVKQTAKSKKKAGGGWGRVKLKDLSIFCRQFSTMIDAGVSLVRSLDVLGEQTQNPKLRRILREELHSRGLPTRSPGPAGTGLLSGERRRRRAG